MYNDLIGELRTRAEFLNSVLGENEDSVRIVRAADAIEELEKQLDEETEFATALNSYVPQWIPVSERVPKGADKSGELCENVWLFFDDGNVYPGWMNGITEKVYYLDNYSSFLMTAPISRVKMWQPRPEPPKED